MVLDFLVALKVLLYIFITDIKSGGLFVFLVSSGVTIGLFMIARYRKSKKNKSISGLELFVYIIFSLIIFGDSIYYSQFGTLPSIKLLAQINQLGAVGDSILELFNLKIILLVVDLPFLLLDYFKYNGKKIINRKIISFNLYSRKYKFIALGILLTGLGLGLSIDSLKAQEIYSYHINDIKDIFKNDKTLVADKDIDSLIDRTKLENGKFTGIGKDKNLIVIQVEALQEFVIDLNYNGVEVTPNLNKLIKNDSTIYYDQYYQLVGRGNTSDAEFVSHNSLYPAMDEPSYVKYARKDFYALPRLLRDRGYETVAFHGFERDFWNREEAYVKQGFNKYNAMDFYKDYETIGMGVSDKDFFEQSLYELEKMAEKDNPFYSFMITLTSHAPFKMPEEYNIIPLEDRHIGTTLGDYIQSIHYVDKEIGNFIEGLKERGIYNDTVIAIYGDHFALSSAHEPHRIVMDDFYGRDYETDEMMHIPLIIHVPNSKVGERINTLGNHLDFYPTILNIMGYENQRGIMFGRDLSNYDGENFVAPQTYLAKGSVILDDRVFVISRDGIFKNSRAYDKKTKEDIDIEEFKTYYEKAIEEINLSDYLINSGMLANYIENGELLAYQKEAVVGKIKKVDNPSLNGLKLKSIFNGNILIDLVEKEGDIFIKGDKNIRLEELLDTTRDKNIRFLFKANREIEEEVLVQAYDNYNLGKHWAVIEDFKSYPNINFNRYENVLFLENLNYDIDETIDFLDRNPNLSIILSRNSELKNVIKDRNKYILD